MPKLAFFHHPVFNFADFVANELAPDQQSDCLLLLSGNIELQSHRQVVATSKLFFSSNGLLQNHYQTVMNQNWNLQHFCTLSYPNRIPTNNHRKPLLFEVFEIEMGSENTNMLLIQNAEFSPNHRCQDIEKT
jgi:hypothetical protein